MSIDLSVRKAPEFRGMKAHPAVNSEVRGR